MCGLAATLQKLDSVKNKELGNTESNFTNKYDNFRSIDLTINIDIIFNTCDIFNTVFIF